MLAATQALDGLAAAIASRTSIRPAVGVVLGSGLGAFGDVLQEAIPYRELAGMPTSSVAGHAGNLRLGTVAAVGVACLQGRVHLYEGYEPPDVVFGVRLLARLGCRAVVLTNAAGGIAPGLRPGDRMLVTDHLNLTGRNPLAGPLGGAQGSALAGDTSSLRFIDMARAYDGGLAKLAHQAARETGSVLREGVYAGLLGPTYETPAEIRMLRVLGADAVGMSTVLEVIALRQLGVRVAAISCITNLAAGISEMPLHHADVQAVSNRTAAPFVALLARLVALAGNELGA
ncbi:MAG TPA: purine-nucleoside phosphorylase [Polyangiaceae bacterium]|nr:purine-nucleoside phosphorylase [Polyangiaceae bacterium]